MAAFQYLLRVVQGGARAPLGESEFSGYRELDKGGSLCGCDCGHVHSAYIYVFVFHIHTALEYLLMCTVHTYIFDCSYIHAVTRLLVHTNIHYTFARPYVHTYTRFLFIRKVHAQTYILAFIPAYKQTFCTHIIHTCIHAYRDLHSQSHTQQTSTNTHKPHSSFPPTCISLAEGRARIGMLRGPAARALGARRGGELPCLQAGGCIIAGLAQGPERCFWMPPVIVLVLMIQK